MALEDLCFEGISGAGKTTQLKLSFSKLSSSGFNAIIVPEENDFEPLKTVITNWKKEGRPKFDKYLVREFAKAKYSVQKAHLFPAISSGKIPLTDRSIFTAAVYQAGMLEPEEILAINIQEGVYLPKKGAILLCSPETALKRIEIRRVEENRPVNAYDSIEDLTKRIEYYHLLSKKYSYLEVINTEKDKKAVFMEICARCKI